MGPIWRKLALEWRLIWGLIVPLGLLPIPLIMGNELSRCAYVVLWMMAYWVTEVIPIEATALMPMVLFPLLGVLSTSKVTVLYMKDSIVLFLGSLIVAAAVENCNLHKRVALRVLLFMGTSVRWMMLGFMLTTMLLSMWINNTASAALMIPVVKAIVDHLHLPASNGDVEVIRLSPYGTVVDGDDRKNRRNSTSDSHNSNKKLETLLLLGVAFSANIGGTGTLTGTAPNLLLKAALEDKFPKYRGLNYTTWMFFNVPVMLLCTLFSWVLLQIVFRKAFRGSNSSSTKEAIKDVIQKAYQDLGPVRFQEKAVLVLFVLLVVLWITQDPKIFPGWAEHLPIKVTDATPSIGVALLLFLIPSNWDTTRRSPPLITWKTAQQTISWGVLLLIGGGLALAEGSKVSGLSEWLGTQLGLLEDVDPKVVLLILTFFTAVLTEVASNTAVTTLALPVVAQLAEILQVHPVYFMLPVTITASFAFMLPVATPPNALVYDKGQMTILDMAVPGLAVTIMCVAVEILFINTLGEALYGLGEFPHWVNASTTTVTLVNTL